MSKNSLLKNNYLSDFNYSKAIGNWYETENFASIVKQVSPDLRWIYISGGEPLLIKQEHLFIDYFLKTGSYKEVVINMNTNLTYLGHSLLKKLAKFKKVKIDVSVDAYGIKNDWIRSPSNFNKIEKNMEKILSLLGNIEVSINCRSAFIIFYIFLN